MYEDRCLCLIAKIYYACMCMRNRMLCVCVYACLPLRVCVSVSVYRWVCVYACLCVCMGVWATCDCGMDRTGLRCDLPSVTVWDSA